jgi:hypothetical protein
MQQQKQVAPVATSGTPTAASEPVVTLAPLSRGWRFVFTLWASAFGLMLAYELFKTVQSLLR